MNAYSEIVAPDLPPDVVLKVDNVSKKFCRNLKRSMWYGLQDLGRNMIGGRRLKDGDSEKRHFSEYCSDSKFQLHTANEGLRKNEFWALRNVSFELKRGECLGLIGQNGCGKSTLLRLLAGIFPPDEGSIAIRGRVGALIALGAGFHPHLTGRENIFLNGAILGLSQTEIRSKFDDIVNFAEIGDFLDAPVSTYSSGMRVRLGFAVAVFSDPDVLLIDEVLAVGDVGFRHKCYSKIAQKLETMAIILVSHSEENVSRFCSSGLLLTNGKVFIHDTVHNAISQYKKQMRSSTLQSKQSIFHPCIFFSAELSDLQVDSHNCVHLNVSISFESSEGLPAYMLRIVLCNRHEVVLGSGSIIVDNDKNLKRTSAALTVNGMMLNAGVYYMSVVFYKADSKPHAMLAALHNHISFKVENNAEFTSELGLKLSMKG
jgi:lipopolysaccharide transport system ATP-binding protein